MRKILIVGAGQAGLHLGHALLDRGYDVTLITARTSTELRTGVPWVTQVSYPTVVEYERELGLAFWAGDVPRIEGVSLGLHPPGAGPVEVAGRFTAPAVAVDRRVKMADWLEYFEDRGGKVVISGIALGDLDFFSRMYDLVVVSVGHGELGDVFGDDPARWAGARPRAITQVLIDDVDAAEGWAQVVSTPQVRILLAPILTHQGPAHSLAVMDQAGGALDGSALKPTTGLPHPEAVLGWIRGVLQAHAPALAEKVATAQALDARSATIATVQPHVRHPVGVLPSGGRVLATTDVFMALDPIAVQGWNASSRCADSYLDDISQHGEGPMNESFLTTLVENYWDGHGRQAAALSDALDGIWSPHAPPHLAEVLTAASTIPAVADRFIRGLDDPGDYDNWLYDPDLARAYLAEVGATAH